MVMPRLAVSQVMTLETGCHMFFPANLTEDEQGLGGRQGRVEWRYIPGRTRGRWADWAWDSGGFGSSVDLQKL